MTCVFTFIYILFIVFYDRTSVSYATRIYIYIYTNIVIIIYDIIYYSGNGGSSRCRDPSRFSFYDRSVWPEAAAAAASRLRAIPLLRSSQGSRSTVVLPDTIYPYGVVTYTSDARPTGNVVHKRHRPFRTGSGETLQLHTLYIIIL